MNHIDQIIAYENGEMDSEAVIDFFQQIINDGLAWTLRGHYGRTAMGLIESGYCYRSANQCNYK